MTKSHSRPRVSNDNPYSESQFKTLKYSPQFPEKFGAIEHARSFCAEFFPWYNHDHHHSGLCLLTPAQVHAGQAEAVLAERHRVLLAAYEAHPERFVRGKPQLKALPKEVWINRPERALALEEGSSSSSTSSFPPSRPSPAAGAAERKTAEAPPAGATTAEQTSEPPVATRTRRKAGGVTSRNEPNQRLGATAAAGRRTGAVPPVASAATAHSTSTGQGLHPGGGVLIETAPA